ncbi:hypothetical protein KUCAC02_004877, partial [Chaenocephalus aceratus]
AKSARGLSDVFDVQQATSFSFMSQMGNPSLASAERRDIPVRSVTGNRKDAALSCVGVHVSVPAQWLNIKLELSDPLRARYFQARPPGAASKKGRKNERVKEFNHLWIKPCSPVYHTLPSSLSPFVPLSSLCFCLSLFFHLTLPVFIDASPPA